MDSNRAGLDGGIKVGWPAAYSLTDAEIKRLQTQLAIAQTARNAYARALAEAVKPAVPAGDTLKL